VDRVKVYPGQIASAKDILRHNRFVERGFGALAESLLGSGQLIDGLAATPSGGLNVTIGTGSVYEQAAVDPTAYSSLPADATLILKQGLALTPEVFNFPAPAGVGNARVYLVQYRLQVLDVDSAVVPYFDSENPTVPWQGPGDNGVAETTTRATIADLSTKSGAVAAIGATVAPTPDAGWRGLYLVTVQNGQAVLSAADIARYPGAGFIDLKLGAVKSYIEDRLGFSEVPGDLYTWANQGR